VLPVDDYPSRLLDTLQFRRPMSAKKPPRRGADPGVYNSAYLEHRSSRVRWAASSSRAATCTPTGGRVFHATTRGMERVDVIYRRTTTTTLDPRVLRPDSCWACRAMKAYMEGKVTLVQRAGDRVADDKASYAYVPKMIKYT